MPARRGPVVVSGDEGVFPTTAEGLAKLAPGRPDGVVNVWPDDLPGFKETLLDYQSRIESLGRKFLPLWAVSLRLPPDYFDTNGDGIPDHVPALTGKFTRPLNGKGGNLKGVEVATSLTGDLITPALSVRFIV